MTHHGGQAIVSEKAHADEEVADLGGELADAEAARVTGGDAAGENGCHDDAGEKAICSRDYEEAERLGYGRDRTHDVVGCSPHVSVVADCSRGSPEGGGGRHACGNEEGGSD